ncbi:hypothetical protein VYU27_007828 [Nannochloropsis oceanica]
MIGEALTQRVSLPTQASLIISLLALKSGLIVNMDPGMDMGGMGGMDMGEGNGYCLGDGMVMNNGFSFMTKGGSCILYLFQGAVVNTAGKYAAAIIGTFFLAFSVEALRHFRFWMRLRRARQTTAAVLAAKEGGEEKVRGVRAQVLPILLEAFLFGSHMFIAYLVMLLVMLYEWAIFISLVLGLAAGYFTMEMWEAYRVAKGKDEPSAMIAVGGGCGCGEEVIHVAAAVGENGGAKGGADDPASSNNKV